MSPCASLSFGNLQYTSMNKQLTIGDGGLLQYSSLKAYQGTWYLLV